MDDLDFELDDIVIFELPTFEDVEAFCDRFRPRWDGWSHADEEVWLVTADLGTGAGDLASLLREAQDLVAELGLPAIRYCLDGRVYVLEAARRHDSEAQPVLAPGR
jgi:hypothetical protein